LTAQLATVLAAQDKAEALPLLQKLHDAHPKDAAITRMLAEVLAEPVTPPARTTCMSRCWRPAPKTPYCWWLMGRT